MKSFMEPSGAIRVVIAFRLGVDCPNICTLLHWSACKRIVAYTRETAAQEDLAVEFLAFPRTQHVAKTTGRLSLAGQPPSAFRMRKGAGLRDYGRLWMLQKHKLLPQRELLNHAVQRENRLRHRRERERACCAS